MRRAVRDRHSNDNNNNKKKTGLNPSTKRIITDSRFLHKAKTPKAANPAATTIPRVLLAPSMMPERPTAADLVVELEPDPVLDEELDDPDPDLEPPVAAAAPADEDAEGAEARAAGRPLIVTHVPPEGKKKENHKYLST